MQILDLQHVGDVEIIRRYHVLRLMRKIGEKVYFYSDKCNLMELKGNKDIHDLVLGEGQLVDLPKNHNTFGISKVLERDFVGFSVCEIVSSIPKEYVKTGTIVEIKSVKRGIGTDRDKRRVNLEIEIYS